MALGSRVITLARVSLLCGLLGLGQDATAAASAPTSGRIGTGPHSNKTKIHLLGLLPVSGTTAAGLQITLPTVKLAMEQINARTDILPDYDLELHWRNTQCSPGPGVDALYHLLFSPPVKTMIVGAFCSIACEPIVKASVLWNLTHIATGCKTPGLSDRSAFPHFFRCTPSEAATIPVFLELLKIHNWKKVALIHEAQEYWSMYSESLYSALDEANVTMIRSEIFLGDPSLQVQNLQKQDARIIFGGFYQTSAVRVLCEAYKIGHYGAHVVWLFVDWYMEHYWRTDAVHTDCTSAQILDVIRTSVLYVGTYKNNPNNLHTPTVGQITRAEAYEYLGSVLGANLEAKINMPFHYDVVWATALTLNRTVQKMKETGFPRGLEEFTYEDTEMTNLITSTVEGLEFQGLAGPIKWTDKNSPDRDLLIQQQWGDTREVVGTYMVGVNNILWSERGILWPRGRPPRDSEVFIFRMVTVKSSLCTLMSCLTSLGILCSVALLGFNVYFREWRIIKMSSPNINNVMLVGCLISYTTVFFYYRENEVLSAQVSCIVTLSTLLVGFSLVFGALFSKTWRIHVIMRQSKKSLKKVIIKDSKLVVIVLGLVMVDVFLIVIWQAIDRFTVVINDGTPEESSTDPDVWIVPQTTGCNSKYETYFFGVLYTIQGLMLAFGAFLAWETRQVTLAAINDSKEIGMCIYNVLILGVMGVLINLVVDDIDVKYGFTSATIIAATALTQGIIFVPKILAVRNGDKSDAGHLGNNQVGDNTQRHSTGVAVRTISSDRHSMSLGLGVNASPRAATVS